jgi:hypothetical protein
MCIRGKAPAVAVAVAVFYTNGVILCIDAFHILHNFRPLVNCLNCWP